MEQHNDPLELQEPLGLPEQHDHHDTTTQMDSSHDAASHSQSITQRDETPRSLLNYSPFNNYSLTQRSNFNNHITNQPHTTRSITS